MRAIPNLPWTALPPTVGVSGKPGQLQLLILRLTARGKARRRRLGSSAVSSSSTATRMAAVIWSGGKGRPGDYLAADDPQASDERQPVGVQVRFEGGGVHHLTQGVVDQQVRPDLLGDQLGALGAQHLPGATLGRLQLPKR